MQYFVPDLATVPAEQILALEDAIILTGEQRVADMALARRTRKTLRDRSCPHCAASGAVLNGKDANGRQRFKCRACGRGFNILTGTPMARARKPEAWGNYLRCMTGHMTVRAIASAGIGINHVTAWRWRHRFLDAAGWENASLLSGIVEAGETSFPWSAKGSRNRMPPKPLVRNATLPGETGLRSLDGNRVAIISAVDSAGSIFDTIISSSAGICPALDGRIAAGSVLCSAIAGAYAIAADKAGAEHRAVTAPPTAHHDTVGSATQQPKGRLGLMRVQGHHARLRQLVDGKCCGVASRYLRRYMGWHRAMSVPGFKGRMLLDLALA